MRPKRVRSGCFVPQSYMPHSLHSSTGTASFFNQIDLCYQVIALIWQKPFLKIQHYECLLIQFGLVATNSLLLDWHTIKYGSLKINS